MKVSVVVAVYNPGDHLQALIDSLLRQSMPPEDFEVVFVDDGSTDGSGRRLDELAARHTHFRVLHIPNSGWPGRPRNLGMATATGEFILIADHDDWLGDEALDRLYARATRNDADVVVAREVGHGFGVPKHMFRRNVDDAKLGVDPLLALLTPHKLFRRSMLEAHGIRFPEGKRRLEDHHFVIQSYFHARKISILADYPVYHWALREDRGNATHFQVDPVGYYANLREILDIVDRHTEPGEFRDRLYAHWYRNKMLYKLRGTRLIDPSAHSRLLFDEIHRLTGERIPQSVDRHIPLRFRLMSRAVRAGRMDLVGELERWASRLRLELVPSDIRLADGTFVLSVAFRMVDEADEPLRFREDGDRVAWIPPDSLVHELGSQTDALEVTQAIRKAEVSVILRERVSRLEHSQAIRVDRLERREADLLMAGTVTLAVDPASAAAGEPLPPGTWDVSVQAGVAGWARAGRLPARVVPDQDPGRAARAYVTQSGHLAFAVAGPRPDPPPWTPRPRTPRRSKPAGRLRRLARRFVPQPARRVVRMVVGRLRG
jgi:poly(ribitol-phosphate) beta-N-acetylglucosaminyltransferase